ncbi:MAG: orotate phosphoribosyltransferase [Alicyclobacillaceae bacterium]|nr:orotate phosphoribosyltransferase [Alicyclobacillaceae bacterium]
MADTHGWTARHIAGLLLDIGAVLLRPEEPFIWTSGIRSPIYCDNRLTISYPEVREVIADTLAKEIRLRFPAAQAVAGTATAGIPHAAWVADRLRLPMVYVRSKPKGHGTVSQIEGRLAPETRVVVVEDLISTGGSALGTVRALRSAGYEPVGVAAIVTYGFAEAAESLARDRVSWFALTDYSTLTELARERGLISPEQWTVLEEFRADPHRWKPVGDRAEGNS